MKNLFWNRNVKRLPSLFNDLHWPSMWLDRQRTSSAKVTTSGFAPFLSMPLALSISADIILPALLLQNSQQLPHRLQQNNMHTKTRETKQRYTKPNDTLQCYRLITNKARMTPMSAAVSSAKFTNIWSSQTRQSLQRGSSAKVATSWFAQLLRLSLALSISADIILWSHQRQCLQQFLRQHSLQLPHRLRQNNMHTKTCKN